MTLFIEVTREQNPFNKQLHYRAKALNADGKIWQGDGIDGNRQQAISKCFVKYEKQGYSTYYILKG
tara:strand:- start:608 stop:805 length:198 start_codon:yes stop_codon:yes gene_type:complete